MGKKSWWIFGGIKAGGIYLTENKLIMKFWREGSRIQTGEDFLAENKRIDYISRNGSE